MKRFLFLPLAVLMLGCQDKPVPADSSLPVDFQVFYELFHRDSGYQMEHIVFPLEGLPDYAEPSDLSDGKYFWQEEEWEIHRQRPDGDEEFQLEWLRPADGVIVERLRHKQRPMMTERRFAKIGGEWLLIYYAGLNTYRQAEPQK